MEDENDAKRISEDIVFVSKNKRYSVKEVVDVIDGKEIRKLFRQGGRSVTIIPLIEKDTILMERQYRVTTRRWMYELPSGKVDSGEDIIDAAKRELEEETGYRAEKMDFLYERFIAPSFTDGVDSVCIADGLTKTKANMEADEVIKVILVKMDRILELIKNNELRNPEATEPLLYWYTFNR